MTEEAERVIRLWRAAEMFSPRPLPEPDIRENVFSVDGGPLPWQPSGRLYGRGGDWRHEVFGGIFRLGGALPATSGESALFTCTVSASGELLAGPDVSECAWAAGQLALGEEAGASGDPSAWLTASSGAGRLPVARENLPGLPSAITVPALERFAAELAQLLGVTALLSPAGLRVRSYTGPAAAGSPLAGYFAADLARVAGSGSGPALRAFLEAEAEAEASAGNRVDVRVNPLAVRDGCSPGRMPAGRWPADDPLVLSEQFAVNEILASGAPLSAVGAPDGATPVFHDLIAAIVTERALALSALPSPEAGFGEPLAWGSHSVSPPKASLTGFEIVAASPGPGEPSGLGDAGPRWRERASGYFASTARLAGGDPWALIRARLDGAAECRAFTNRFWHGRIRGSEVLFVAGEPLRSALRSAGGPGGGWPASVAAFRAALDETEFLSSERISAADTLARFSALEAECEEAYSRLEQAEARASEMVSREPAVREAVVAAEERRRAAADDLRAHQSDRPGLTVAMSTGLRASREWYAAHADLRSVLAAAMAARDSALSQAQELRSGLAAERQTAARSRETADRCAAAMEALQAPAAAARKRWGDHVPEGPSYAETEDAALIERRENSAPWSDPEYASARTSAFLAALALHEAWIRANAGVVEANLSAWAEMVSGRPGPAGPEESAGPPPAEVALAAWQTFFLVVPVVSVSLGSAGALLDGLGPDSLGWLLADGCGGVPPRHLAGVLWRARRAVVAGCPDPGSAGDDCALTRAARATRFGTLLPDGTWTGLPLYQRPGRDPVPDPADRSVSDTEMLRAVLSDLRQRARSRRGTRAG
ncbi:MAG: hypothetical protein FWE35_16775 [Streptosporangiales bacterium]|nr:hypothetical protein [Streptosporangiales bacterium]